MALRKHGVGEVLPDDSDTQHTASQSSQDGWDGKNEQELQSENED